MSKTDVLRGILSSYAGAAVAYSGGADSAFLADVCADVLGPRMIAVTAVSASLAPAERSAAAGLARERGWRHVEIDTHELQRPEYRANDGSRCYHCKDELFTALEPLAERLGVERVLVGTNVDDLGDFRPGLRAAAEHGVSAPLVEAGFTKRDVREASRARGLPTWDKPASPCLASRIAYGIEVTEDRLARVAEAEAFLRGLGFRELRVRDLGRAARVEVPLTDLPRLHAQQPRVIDRLRKLGYSEVAIDEEGFRSGSMNVALGMPARRMA
jgi:pyridinium-3,5-biscarboxylic acid mononucleotide sulfurtransferase